MVKQYPHTIRITVAGEPTQDEEGNLQPPSPSNQDRSCRYEPSSGRGMIRTADGQMINYEGIAYLPLPAATIQPGSQVTILDSEGAVLLTDKVKRFSAGQLNARVWL